MNELVVSWFDPCSNLPDNYDVFYWSAPTWVKLLSHDTSSDGLSPCLLTSSDSDTVAICFDFFAPILTTKFRVQFNNTGPQFASTSSRGGWIYEIEPHGVFVNQPVSQSLSFGTSPLCVSTGCSLTSAQTVSIPTITYQLLTILNTPATANNIGKKPIYSSSSFFFLFFLFLFCFFSNFLALSSLIASLQKMA